VIKARFGRDVDEDLKERLVARLYTEAIREKGLSPLGDPGLKEVTLEEGRPFRFETTFEVTPQFEPKGYREVEVRRPPAEVTDQDVRSAIEDLQQAHTRFVTEEGKTAATGDVIVADVEGAPAGGETFRKERVVMEVGASNNLPEFNDNLEGATAGTTLEFAVSYPEGYDAKELAGKSVDYKLHVHEVKRREVPELDDEFAKDLGEFETLADLEARVREDLLERKKAESDSAVRQSVIDKVLLENPIPLPDVLVDSETRHRLEDMVRLMVQQGVDPRSAEVDWKALRQRQEDPARKSVHARLVLDAVARAEGIEVGDDELSERLRKEAERIGETEPKLRARLEKHDGLEAFKIQVVREKSLDFLVSVANIQGEE
jgi:trigger factor